MVAVHQWVYLDSVALVAASVVGSLQFATAVVEFFVVSLAWRYAVVFLQSGAAIGVSRVVSVPGSFATVGTTVLTVPTFLRSISERAKDKVKRCRR